MWFEQLDQLRRQQGQWLDALGYGPVQTPARTVLSTPALTLKAYDSPRNGSINGRRPKGAKAQPALLIVPAPIKRAYIWDIAPAASVVQACLRQGIAVYLIQWEHPDVTAQQLGLADYADRGIAACLDAIAAERGPQPPFIAGHSLGGTLAAIFAALQPERLQGLLLLGAPLHFGPDTGIFESMLAQGPAAAELTAQLGNVPGSFLDQVCLLADPTAFFAAPWQDWLACAADSGASRLHLQVRRWTLDEMPLPRCLFEEVVEKLYRGNELSRGTLQVDGRRAAPQQISAPLLNVVERGSRLVPPQAVQPVHEKAASRNKEWLWYDGDQGVVLQHVGPLVGKQAHRTLWPRILEWLHAQHEPL
jgi:polyhydroxyalkanoate synthase